MAKRWSYNEDVWVITWFGIVDASNIGADISRSAKAVTARAKHLKETGAWDAYKTGIYHTERARALAGGATKEEAEALGQQARDYPEVHNYDLMPV